MENHINTEPGTEQNLALEADAHPFDAEAVTPSPPHPVLVDGICGVAAIGTHGTYSTRIKVWLSEELQSSDERSQPSTSESKSPVEWNGAIMVNPSPSTRFCNNPA